MRAGSLHEKRPWKTVIHIDTIDGPRGGKAWALKLECGHTAFRAQPALDAARAIGQSINEVVRMGVRPRFRLRTAPHRVRCLWCPRDEASS